MRRVLFGNDGAGDIVFRISKTGKDIFSTNLDDFLLNEQLYNTLPVASGTINLPTTASFNFQGHMSYTYSADIPHGLGFVPMFIHSMDGIVTALADEAFLHVVSGGTSPTSPTPFSYAIFGVPVA